MLLWQRRFPSSVTRLQLGYLPINLFVVFLDLAASVSTGLLIAVATVDEQNLDAVLKRLGPLYLLFEQDKGKVNAIAILVVLILLIFTLRMISSVLIQHSISKSISKKATNFLEICLMKMSKSDSRWIEKQDWGSSLRILHVGTNTFIVNGIINFQSLLQETFLLVAVLCTLLRVDLGVTVSLLLILLAGVILSNFFTLKKMRKLIKQLNDSNTEVQKSFFRFLDYFLELRLSRQFDYAIQRIANPYKKATLSNAQQGVIIGLSRQIIEIWGILTICMIAVLTTLKADQSESAVVLGIFLVGLTRIIPAIQRINSSWAAINSSKEVVQELWNFIDACEHNTIENSLIPTAERATSEGPAKVDLENASLVLGGRTIFHHLNLSVSSGERLIVCGKSGVGKSSLLYVIAGHLQTNHGSVQIDNLSPVAYIRGNPGKISILRAHKEAFGPSIEENFIGSGSFDYHQLTEDASDLGLISRIRSRDEFLKSKYDDFSLGEKQRIGFLQAIFFRPNLLLLDEPSSHLDRKSEHALFEKLDYINSTQIVATHSIDLLRRHNGRIMFMIDEENVLIGLFSDLLDDSRFQEFIEWETSEAANGH